jgi:amino acid permease
MKTYFVERRIGAGIILLLTLLSAANHIMGWKWLEPHDKPIMVAMFVLTFLYYVFVGPTLAEILDRQEVQSTQERPIKVRRWVYVVTIVCLMLLIVFIGPALQAVRGEQIGRKDRILFAIMEAAIVVAGMLGWYGLRRLARGKSNRG